MIRVVHKIFQAVVYVIKLLLTGIVIMFVMYSYRDYPGLTIHYGWMLLKSLILAHILYLSIKNWYRVEQWFIARYVRKLEEKLKEDPDYVKKVMRESRKKKKR